MKFNLLKAVLITGIPIIWIKFFSLPLGFTWYKLFLVIFATLGGFFFALEDRK